MRKEKLGLTQHFRLILLAEFEIILKISQILGSILHFLYGFPNTEIQ